MMSELKIGDKFICKTDDHPDNVIQNGDLVEIIGIRDKPSRMYFVVWEGANAADLAPQYYCDDSFSGALQIFFPVVMNNLSNDGLTRLTKDLKESNGLVNLLEGRDTISMAVPMSYYKEVDSNTYIAQSKGMPDFLAKGDSPEEAGKNLIKEIEIYLEGLI